VNAIYVWGLARARGGRVLLRVEDHDRIRCRPEFEAALLADLDWLGFVPDEGRHPVLRQSDRHDLYAAALDRLRAENQVYVCTCSRREIQHRARRLDERGGDERYDGRCRERRLDEGPGRGWRVLMPGAPERFTDLRLGPLEQTPAQQCGDLLLRDRDGHWTYQFAAVVDDFLQDVTLVIRGEDLLSSTGRQMALARLLGRQTPPAFLHHPLIVKASGQKLSKAAGDTGVRQLRADGLSAADVIGRAAAAVGLVKRPRPITAAEVSSLF
jgi:glutamyl-tRNA synthetase/glutamyl-Q tRNA(Asp) synthetase